MAPKVKDEDDQTEPQPQKQRKPAPRKSGPRIGSADPVSEAEHHHGDSGAEGGAADSSGAVRLQKFLSECGVASRRRSEQLIIRGRVQVNDIVVTELGTKVRPNIDQVRVKGKLVQPVEKGILLLNKPVSVLTTMDDPEGRTTVADLLSKRYASYFPVGRLDWDSSGLVIMTNDGELAQRLTHPKYEMDRTYDVMVDGTVSYEVCDKIAAGVMLHDGVVKGDAHVLEFPEHQIPGKTWIRITISIGRNRVVRRLFDKLGHPVLVLHRIKHGPFKLGNLDEGQIRKLEEREYREMRNRILG